MFTLAVLYSHGRVSPAEASTAVPDCLLGLLFVAAFVKTGALVTKA